MKLFDIANMSRRGHWIIAESEEDAKAVFSNLFPRSKIRDVVELDASKEDTSLTMLLNGEHKGWIGKEATVVTAQKMLQQLRDTVLLKQPVKIPQGKWFFLKEHTK
jgi:hypothetical protein